MEFDQFPDIYITATISIGKTDMRIYIFYYPILHFLLYFFRRYVFYQLKTDRANPVNAEMQLINLENLCGAAETGCLQVDQYFPQISAVLLYLSVFCPALFYQRLDNTDNIDNIIDHTRGKAHYSGKIALFYSVVIMVDVPVNFYFLFYCLFIVHLLNNIVHLRFFINIKIFL